MKVIVKKWKIMDITEEEFEYLQIACKEGDMQMFNEIAQIDYDGHSEVEMVEK